MIFQGIFITLCLLTTQLNSALGIHEVLSVCASSGFAYAAYYCKDLYNEQSAIESKIKSFCKDCQSAKATTKSTYIFGENTFTFMVNPNNHTRGQLQIKLTDGKVFTLDELGMRAHLGYVQRPRYNWSYKNLTVEQQEIFFIFRDALNSKTGLSSSTYLALTIGSSLMSVLSLLILKCNVALHMFKK
jgi:hypothetical protein